MNRRDLLEGAAIISTIGLAGCTEEIDSIEGTDATSTEATTDTTTTPEGVVRENTDGNVIQAGVVTDVPSEFQAGSSVPVTGEIEIEIEDAQDSAVYGAVGTPDGELYGLKKMSTTGSGTVTVSASLPDDAAGETLVWTFIPAGSESEARSQYKEEAVNERYRSGDLAISLGEVAAAEVERKPGRIYRENNVGAVFQSGAVTEAPTEIQAGSSVPVTGEIEIEIEDAQDNIVYGAIGTPDGELYGLKKMSTTGSGTVTVSASLPDDAAGETLIWTFIPAVNESEARSQYQEEAANDRYRAGELAISLGEIGQSSGTFDVGVVYYIDGHGDGSINDQAKQGLIQAAGDYPVDYDEAKPEEIVQVKNYQHQFAQSTDPNYDLIPTIGNLQSLALEETAPEYPDQNFMIVDSVVDEPNVSSYTFKEHEGSYLVGRLAGLLTARDFSAGAGSTNPDANTVGFVGGIEGDLIGKFEAGFIAGVKSVDEEIEVTSSYAGSFNEPATGEEIANSMYENGTDVIYHASGNTGMGVFAAAQAKGRFAIGSHRDQSIGSYADVILASMVKRFDTAVYTGIQSAINDGFRGNEHTLGVEQDGVAIGYGSQLGSEIPQHLKNDVSSARESIVNGEIDVPTDPDKA